jgi:hypothetical protein
MPKRWQLQDISANRAADCPVCGKVANETVSPARVRLRAEGATWNSRGGASGNQTGVRPAGAVSRDSNLAKRRPMGWRVSSRGLRPGCFTAPGRDVSWSISSQRRRSVEGQRVAAKTMGAGSVSTCAIARFRGCSIEALNDWLPWFPLRQTKGRASLTGSSSGPLM